MDPCGVSSRWLTRLDAEADKADLEPSRTSVNKNSNDDDGDIDTSTGGDIKRVQLDLCTTQQQQAQ